MKVTVLQLVIVTGMVSNIAADERPNIVFILADDLGYETVGCYGGESYPTPHLDALAESGMKLNRAYAMPLCTNSRIQLMTGRYNNRNWKAFGILDPQEPTFGTLMKKAGYRTCIAGKWQLTSYDPPDYPGADLRRNTGVHPRDAGFDEYSCWHVGHTEDKGSRYADPVIEQNGERLTGLEGQYGPDLWTDFISDFMSRNASRPFFVYYSMALPHNPMNPTPDSPEWADPKNRFRDETHFAADMIRYTDKMVGKVVRKIDELDLRRKTLVLFYSDNGTNWRVRSVVNGHAVRGGKGKATELGIRVPAIASWPSRIAAGKTSTGLIDSVDPLPTFLTLAGRSDLIPQNLDGVSFAEELLGHGTTPRTSVYIHQDPRPGWDKDRFWLTRVALNQRFKLYEDGRLFDLQRDDFEQHPLFADTDNAVAADARRSLQSVLDEMKPYPQFDPNEVPRPDPARNRIGHQFEDQGGLVIAEAEQLPVARDESWIVENSTPGYDGTGYLRSIRDQEDPPSTGSIPLYLGIDNAGEWSLSVRCRSDHIGGGERTFWVRHEGAPWMKFRIPDNVSAAQWTWVHVTPQSDGSAGTVVTFPLKEGGNRFFIAPCAQNLKIDRIAVYQQDTSVRALRRSTPSSRFHPWARP